MKIEVDLITFVFVGLQLRKVLGLALTATCGVGGAGNGAGHTHADLFPLEFIHRYNVNTGQKVGRLLHRVHQRLRDGRVNAEFLGNIANVDAVQLSDTGQISIKFKAGFRRICFPEKS
jgi:hypothetical protein